MAKKKQIKTKEERRLPLVMIAVPSGDMVHADFAMSLVELFAYPSPVGKILANTKFSLITVARNMAVEAAQQAGADWLLFLDSDMTFPPYALNHLLQHDKKIIGATYCKRVSPYQTLGTPKNKKENKFSTGLIEMERIPTGCLLIHMSVFDKLRRPYFRCLYDESNGGIHSEDYIFCDMAREKGLDVWCDIDLSKQMGHIGQQVFKIKQG